MVSLARQGSRQKFCCTVVSSGLTPDLGTSRTTPDDSRTTPGIFLPSTLFHVSPRVPTPGFRGSVAPVPASSRASGTVLWHVTLCATTKFLVLSWRLRSKAKALPPATAVPRPCRQKTVYANTHMANTLYLHLCIHIYIHTIYFVVIKCVYVYMYNKCIYIYIHITVYMRYIIYVYIHMQCVCIHT